MPGAEALLPPHLLRSLGQKEYDKRKGAALEIEQTIKELRDTGQHDKVRDLVQYVVVDLAGSPHPNVRKGALHALAGVAIGLREELPRFLPEILPPILAAFTDPDCRVRYYACESLYNVAKVARGAAVPHFNQIFEALFKLSADTDLGVQNGFQLLDRLMKDIVAESHAFDLPAFVPLLRRRIFVANSYTRQFLIGWVSILDSLPDIDLLTHLPQFFDGLFHMLSDQNKEIRQQANAVLSDFLQEIMAASALAYEPIVAILVQHCGSRDRFSRLTALTWLHAFLSLGRAELLPFCPAVLEAVLRSISHSEDEIREAAVQADGALRNLLASCADADFDVQSIVGALAAHACAASERTRLTALEWVEMLLRQRPSALLRHVDTLWPALIKALGDGSEDVLYLALAIIARLAAQRSHFASSLSRIVRALAADRALLEARAPLILRELTLLLEPRRVYLELAAAIRAAAADEPAAEDAAAEAATNGAAAAASAGASAPATGGASAAVAGGAASGASAAGGGVDEGALAKRGGAADLAFCALLVQTLNGILHTSPALEDLRDSLRAATGGGDGASSAEASAAGAELFAQLYTAWCHAPVALLSLCLLAEAYEHACELISRFAAVEGGAMGSIEFLVQLDRLVQLLEAPVFARLRLQLLQPERSAPLVRTLYGILMLLPQGGAYQTLAQRLSAVPQIGLLRLSEAGLGGAGAKPPPARAAGGGAACAPQLDFTPLRAAFDAAQGRQRALSRTAHEMRRLRFVDSE